MFADPTMYLACTSFDDTGACLQQVWVSLPSVVPALSSGDGAKIGAAILAVWAVGFGIRHMRRLIR